jgi:hypothetical protein
LHWFLLSGVVSDAIVVVEGGGARKNAQQIVGKALLASAMSEIN